MSDRPVLVLGGTGKTGRRLTKALQHRGVPTRPASRSTTPRFDWSDRTTWSPAVEGARAVYLAHPHGAPHQGELTQDIIRVALAAGVEHLVLLSSRSTHLALPFYDDFLANEQAVRSGAVPWTILRPSWFNQNFSEDIFLDQVLTGTVRLPTGEGQEPFIDATDIAEVAAEVLTTSGHSGASYELAGPALMSFPAAVAEIARVTGRTITFEHGTDSEYVVYLVDQGLPRKDAVELTETLVSIRNGDNAYPSDGVRQVLGRAPRTFAEYARTAADDGVWDPTAGVAQALPSLL